MSDIIATSTDRMRSDIATYDSQLSAMEKAFDEAWQAVEALNATWEGPAHNTLVRQFIKDQQVMKELMISLRNYREELENARTEYETCERDVNSLVGSMNV